MDLANIDLDGDTSASAEGQDELELSSEPEMVEAPAHSKTEDLHLYFQQSFRNRVGLPGMFIIAFFGLTLLMISATLVFSYTVLGRSFLQNLVFSIF